MAPSKRTWARSVIGRCGSSRPNLYASFARAQRNHIADLLQILGLSWLHAHQYIHHALSPANILVGGDGHCAIAGLDSCRRVGRGRKLQSDGLDFALAMTAPELQVQGAEYDEKVDVWSLGVTVSELLTGKVRGARH